ncbi:hypothetical protein C6P78_10455 [Burkholderia multivorans]|nr:hypothetical protein C6P78_10455 [Burkholderia multivorans]
MRARAQRRASPAAAARRAAYPRGAACRHGCTLTRLAATRAPHAVRVHGCPQGGKAWQHG